MHDHPSQISSGARDDESLSKGDGGVAKEIEKDENITRKAVRERYI